MKTEDIHLQICKVYGDNAMSDSKVKKRMLYLVILMVAAVSCNLTSAEETCKLDLLRGNINDIYGEARSIELCVLNKNTRPSYDAQCLITEIRRKLKCNQTQVYEDVSVLLCDRKLQVEINDFDCVVCLLVHFNRTLESHKHVAKLRENFSTLFFMTSMKINEIQTNNSDLKWIKHLLDIKIWTHSPYVDFNRANKYEISQFLKLKKFMEVNTSISNVPVELYIIIVLSMFVILIGLVGNILLIIICVCHKDTNTIVFSQAIAHIIYITITTLVMFFPSVSFRFWLLDPKIFAVFFVWSVATNASIHSVTMITFQRYVAVVSRSHVHVPDSVFVYTLWIFSVIVTLPVLSLYFGHPFYKLKILFLCNLFTLVVIPITIVATLSVAMSLHLRKSIVEMPGEDVGQEMVKQSRRRSAKILILLSVVFVASYSPPHVLNILMMFNVIQPEMYLISISFISFILIFLNACFSPIGIYIISARFRQHFNTYICGCKRKNRINV